MMRVIRLVLGCLVLLTGMATQGDGALVTIDFELRNSVNVTVGAGSFQFDDALDGSVIGYGDLASFDFTIPAPFGSGTTYDLAFLNSGDFSPYYGMSFDTSTDTFGTLNVFGFPLILSAIKNSFSEGFFVRPPNDNPLVRDYAANVFPEPPYATVIVERSEAAAVPEPSSLALLGASAVGLIAARRRKKQQQAA